MIYPYEIWQIILAYNSTNQRRIGTDNCSWLYMAAAIDEQKYYKIKNNQSSSMAKKFAWFTYLSKKRKIYRYELMCAAHPELWLE